MGYPYFWKHPYFVMVHMTQIVSIVGGWTTYLKSMRKSNWNAFPRFRVNIRIVWNYHLVGMFLLSVYLSFLPVDLQPPYATQPYTCYCYILPQILLEPWTLQLFVLRRVYPAHNATSLNANSWETCSERKIHPQSSRSGCNSLISQVCGKTIGIYRGGPKKSHQWHFSRVK